MKAQEKKTIIGPTPTTDKPVSPPVSATPSAEVQKLVVPIAFSQADKTLKQEELRFAIELGAKFPSIVQEADSLKVATAEADATLKRMGQKYFGFCNELRKAKLNRRESTLLLKGLGFVKTRISEILRVSETSDEIWEKFASGSVGFKSVLALERGGGEEGEGGEGEGEKEKPAKSKNHKMPKEFQKPFIAVLEDIGDSLKATSAKEAYLFRWENDEKRTYVVTVQAIDPVEKAKE